MAPDFCAVEAHLESGFVPNPKQTAASGSRDARHKYKQRSELSARWPAISQSHVRHLCEIKLKPEPELCRTELLRQMDADWKHLQRLFRSA